MVDFVGASKGIVDALNVRSMSMEHDERIRYVYNNAIEDAVDFVRTIGVKNPDVRLACMRLEREMREWLPLRSEETSK